VSIVVSSSELVPINIEDEMKRSYLDYAMSVIVSRALPDVRDGLKPVHRRILYAMHESGCYYDKPFRKSARIVGEVMGKYHPHGDTAIYDALVRMAQDFSLRLPLIDGQGNFGSMDGDAPAAMRYTESRMAKVAHTMLSDIEFDTVEFHQNYDGSEEEPNVLPARFPNLLVNGGGGIAVGMATNIPPYNLGEVIDACCAYIGNRELKVEELTEFIKGPDFPTGGIILGLSGIRSGITTGRGSVIIRAKTNFEEINGRQAIIVTEVPYQVNKAKMVEKIAEMVRDKKIEGIAGLRDESNKNGVRVVIECKREAVPDVVLNQLLKYTPMQTSFGVNMLALDRGVPKLMNVLDVIKSFITFREEVVTRRTIYLLTKAKDRAHLLLGLIIAVANIDEVIALIKRAADPAEAKQELMNRTWQADEVMPLIRLVEESGKMVEMIQLSEAQAKAILDMRLHRLTGLEHQKLREELQEIAEAIRNYQDILASRDRLMGIIRKELEEVREEFATPRLTSIENAEFEQDIEDLIQREDMVITVTMGGYIKRVPLSTYRAQRRGGKGRSALTMNAEDITTQVFVTNTHTEILFFSTLGKVYKLKVYRLPLGSPQSKGRALVNILPLAENETINNIVALPEDINLEELNIVFATKSGNIRRNSIADFSNIQSNGKIAMKLDPGDSLIGVSLCNPTDHILLATRDGKAVRFPVESVRVFKGRTSDGVRGIKLASNDHLISMSVLSGAEVTMEEREEFLKIPVGTRQAIRAGEVACVASSDVDCSLPAARVQELCESEEFILSITENGYGKRSSAYEYRITNRGGQGIVNIITSERNGKVTATFPAAQKEELMLVTNKGKLIRVAVCDIRIIGRNTQGVRIFNISDGEYVASAALIAESEDNDEGDISEV